MISLEDAQKYDCFGNNGNWELIDLALEEYFLNEYKREINQDHPLYNISFQPIARCISKDDVLFLGDNDKWVIVHLTYSDKNLKGWPRFKAFETCEMALKHMEMQYKIEFS